MPNTNTKSTMYTHEINFTDVTIGTDRNGRAYAKWAGTTVVRTGARAGQEMKIFGMAFGDNFERMRDQIFVGNTARFGGFHDRLPPRPEDNGRTKTTFTLIRLQPVTQQQSVANTNAPMKIPTAA